MSVESNPSHGKAPGRAALAMGSAATRHKVLLSACPLIFRIILLCLSPLFLPGTGGAAAPGGPPPSVVVASVTEADIVPASEYVGHVEAIQTVDLQARVEDFLEKVVFTEGDFVQAGDLLYLIAPEAYQARAAADQAKVDQAKAELAQADSYLQRLGAARPESVPATDLDKAAAALATSKARLAEAEANLTLSALNLSYTTIKAPISGRIGRTAYTRGNLVNPQSGTLARINQMDPIRVGYSISENDLVAIEKARAETNQKTPPLLAPQLRLANGEPLAGTGQVTFVDNNVDPATGTIAVLAEFANPDNMLIPGQYVTVTVKATDAQLLPVVPHAAVLADKNGRYVFMVDENGLAVPRAIITGSEVGGGWAVTSGLRAGEEIIVSGIQKVRPGQPVQVTRQQAQGNQP